MVRRANPLTLNEAVLRGPTPALSARLKLSYARLFNSRTLQSFAAVFNLSDKQLQAAILIAKGVPRRDLPEAMGVSPGTFQVHRQRLYQKLGVCCGEHLILKLILGSGVLLTDEDREMLSARPEVADVLIRKGGQR